MFDIKSQAAEEQEVGSKILHHEGCIEHGSIYFADIEHRVSSHAWKRLSTSIVGHGVPKLVNQLQCTARSSESYCPKGCLQSIEHSFSIRVAGAVRDASLNTPERSQHLLHLRMLHAHDCC